MNTFARQPIGKLGVIKVLLDYWINICPHIIYKNLENVDFIGLARI